MLTTLSTMQKAPYNNYHCNNDDNNKVNLEIIIIILIIIIIKIIIMIMIKSLITESSSLRRFHKLETLIYCEAFTEKNTWQMICI